MPEVLAEPFDFTLVLQEALDAHLRAALRAYEGVEEEDLLSAARPVG